MKKDTFNILILLKSKYHEMLLSKEISSRINDSHVITVQSKSEVMKLISTQSISLLIVDINAETLDDCCDVHKIHDAEPSIPIIAVVENSSEKFTHKLYDIGVSEILMKDETFHVVMPGLVKGLLARQKSLEENIIIEKPHKLSEHIKITARTLSHEINNPLMSILGLAELILDDEFQYDQELIQKIKVIQQSAFRIQETTHRLAHLSSPVYDKTAYGMIINPQKSRISGKSTVKLDETE